MEETAVHEAETRETELAVLREHVEAGARFLDATVKDWADRINVDRLDMSNGYLCVLGQLYGDYFTAKTAIAPSVQTMMGRGRTRANLLDMWYGLELIRQLALLGFTCTRRIEDFRLLTQLWSELITERRPAGTRRGEGQ